MSEASLARAAEAIAGLPRDRRTLVAVDGLDGAGKTTFADRLAPLLDRPAVRVREDDFLNPAAIRHRRGRESPEGFFRDSYDLEALARDLLDPFAAGGPFRRRVHDLRADALRGWPAALLRVLRPRVAGVARAPVVAHVNVNGAGWGSGLHKRHSATARVRPE